MDHTTHALQRDLRHRVLLAEKLDAFNDAIIGRIELLHAFGAHALERAS